MNALEKAGLQVTAGMTTPSRPGKRPRPVWNVTGNLAPWVSLLVELGGRKYRGVFSFFADPTQMLEEHLAATAPATYEDQLNARAARAEARVDRRTEWADKAQARSEAAFASARAAVAGIPPGQPILVGHHSERRHRRVLERHDGRMRRGFEEKQRSEHHAARAAGAELTAARARGDVKPAFAERRVREAEGEIRRFDRMLEGPWCSVCHQSIRDDNACADQCAGAAERETSGAATRLRTWTSRVRGEREQQVQKRDYWRAVLESLGVTYSRSTIATGDHVKVRSHDWARVVRCNPTTVSITWDDGPLRGMSGKYLYSEIEAHRTAEK